MIALIGLLCYANCILFSAAMPWPVDSMADLDDDDCVKPSSRPLDFWCPISLKLMCNPIVAPAVRLMSGERRRRGGCRGWKGQASAYGGREQGHPGGKSVMQLAHTGPSNTEKDALAMLLSLSGERENIGKLVEAGATEEAVSAISEAEAASVLSALSR
ncbi:hypothetical protein BAE44_0020553 [Dichanthelium oligosanthes]|uniref:UBA domain-containing protein n=1 Tax=Dichanthelium oligosanthes TaxID=888268 RepID=A0A1E5V006_9POAL|nr:hypothetical protein BAE44_0020553 [Dichanthelium oligosanthes]